MLIVKYKHSSSELIYSLDIILNEFLGLNYKFEEDNSLNLLEITSPQNDSTFTLNTDFFSTFEKHKLQLKSLPKQPLMQWDPLESGIKVNLVEKLIPIIYGKPGLEKKQEKYHHLNVDIFGSAFFMLSRYEELIINIRDKHNRFPAYASVSYQENFLSRPIINEYVEIFWSCISALFPTLQRKKRIFRKLISCDVDHPIDKAAGSLKKIIRRVGANILRDKNIKLASLNILNYLSAKVDLNIFDEYKKNINWIIRVNNLKGNIITFNFIPIQTSKIFEDNNDIESDRIKLIIREIITSGHKVGIHPGYETCDNSEKFKLSVTKFRNSLLYLNIHQSTIGGRQHYLKYNISITPRLWDESNINYDSSLAYAEIAGFRAGCCYEYTMYDLIERKKMSLKQRPLIVMDCTVISKSYEALGFTEKAMRRFKYFENICRKFNGDYTLLWHNSFFENTKSKRFYLDLISD